LCGETRLASAELRLFIVHLWFMPGLRNFFSGGDGAMNEWRCQPD
jgi:hypothetical protein